MCVVNSVTYIRQIAAICEPCKPNCKKGLMVKRLSRVFRFSVHVHLAQVLDDTNDLVTYFSLVVIFLTVKHPIFDPHFSNK